MAQLQAVDILHQRAIADFSLTEVRSITKNICSISHELRRGAAADKLHLVQGPVTGDVDLNVVPSAGSVQAKDILLSAVGHPTLTYYPAAD